MQGQNCLGIYLSKNRATILCLGSQAQDVKLLGCFSVSPEGVEATPQVLAEFIARGCAERHLQFSEAAVALDCAMFMQHKLHSDFSDQKRIATTIRFDTEEALAMDISEAVVAFEIAASDQTGSSLNVFTAQRKVLSDILAALQANNIDPISIEPDINCLSRFVRHSSSGVVSQQCGKTFYGILSSLNGYFIFLSAAQKQLAARAFLLSSQQNRTELLSREMLLAAALVSDDGPAESLKVFDSTGSVDCRQLGDRLGLRTDELDLAGAGGAEADNLGGHGDPVDFAISYGAALACLEKQTSLNFRNDFSPYQGGKQRLEKTIKLLSISAAIVIFAIGVYFQSRLVQKNGDIRRLNEKLAKQYSTIMLGKKIPPESSVSKLLAGELRRIKAAKSGQLSAGEEAIPVKLTLVLEAFNKCAAQTDLRIDTITITERNINIVGNTSNRNNTLKLFEALKSVNLSVQQQRLDPKADRDTFSVTVVPKSG
jgi:cell division protein FtsL